MAKDKRYNTVKKLILAGAIEQFNEILDTVPKTTLARDLGMHHLTFGKLLTDPERFTFKEAFRIAALIDVDQAAVINLIYKQCVAYSKAKKKKP